MRQIESEGKTYECRHGDVWPPAHAYMGTDPLTVRAEHGEEAMSRYQVWQRECGLLRMDATKCSNCPHVIVDGVPRTKSNAVMPPFMRRMKRR